MQDWFIKALNPISTKPVFDRRPDCVYLALSNEMIRNCEEFALKS